MAVGAYVRCRCWEEQKVITPPPSAEHVRLTEDRCLILDLPWKGNEEKHNAFRAWLESCCAHPGMHQAGGQVSNWYGMRAFQSRLLEFDSSEFPVLQKILPDGGGGMLVQADLSAAALAELADFARRDQGSRIVLFDAESGRVVNEYVSVYGGKFSGRAGWQVSIDPKGFFIQDEETGKEWFRSRAFCQERLGPEYFRLTDEQSGKFMVTDLGVFHCVPWPDGRMQNDEGRLNVAYPTRLVVENRKREPGHFSYILDPLTSVFRASVETGNPVMWIY